MVDLIILSVFFNHNPRVLASDRSKCSKIRIIAHFATIEWVIDQQHAWNAQIRVYNLEIIDLAMKCREQDIQHSFKLLLLLLLLPDSLSWNNTMKRSPFWQIHDLYWSLIDFCFCFCFFFFLFSFFFLIISYRFKSGRSILFLLDILLYLSFLNEEF
jgi:hypothetical protein